MWEMPNASAKQPRGQEPIKLQTVQRQNQETANYVKGKATKYQVARMGKNQQTKSCLRKQNQPNCQLGHIILLLIANLGITEIYTGEDTLSLHDALPICKAII